MTKNRFDSMTLKERAVYLIEKYNHVKNPENSGEPSKDWNDFELISFIFKEGRKWIAIDNRTGDCWVEEFRVKKYALWYIS